MSELGSIRSELDSIRSGAERLAELASIRKEVQDISKEAKAIQESLVKAKAAASAPAPAKPAATAAAASPAKATPVAASASPAKPATAAASKPAAAASPAKPTPAAAASPAKPTPAAASSPTKPAAAAAAAAKPAAAASPAASNASKKDAKDSLTANRAAAAGGVVKVQDEDKFFQTVHDVHFGSLDWCFVAYGANKSDVKMAGSGSGGLEELTKLHLKSDAQGFALLKMHVGSKGGSAHHFVLLAWCGPEIKPLQKARMSTHQSVLQKVLGPIPLCINASDAQEASRTSVEATVKRYLCTE